MLSSGAGINERHQSVTNNCVYAWPILACTGVREQMVRQRSVQLTIPLHTNETK